MSDKAILACFTYGFFAFLIGFVVGLIVGARDRRERLAKANKRHRRLKRKLRRARTLADYTVKMAALGQETRDSMPDFMHVPNPVPHAVWAKPR